MKLQVHHATTYRYASPMRTLVQSVKLFPSRTDGQVVTDWQVTVEGYGPQGEDPGLMQQTFAGMSQTLGGMTQSMAAGLTQTSTKGHAAHIGAAFRDGAGDWTETISVRGPVSSLEITVSGTVETTDLSGVLRGHREAVPPGAYLQSTMVTEPDVALTELAREVIAAEGDGQGTLALAHRLSGAIADAIA